MNTKEMNEARAEVVNHLGEFIAACHTHCAISLRHSIQPKARMKWHTSAA